MRLWLLAPAVALLFAPAATAQADGPVDVDVVLALVSFGNYDAKQGTYVLDFYLVLSWNTTTAPADFTAEGFEFANGRATSRDLQYDTLDNATGIRTLWHRVQAELYSEPKFDAYPFDHQTIEVRLEDKVHPESQLRYVPNLEESGLENSFQAAGWQIRGTKFEVASNDYSFDEPYSQARFVVTLQRSVLSGVLKVIVPPLAFVAISGVAFLLMGADKIATRFALTGNMAISGVMFHGAQAGSLPSLSHLIFLDRYMLAIDAFLFVSVGVTALVALAEMKWKSPTKAKRINWLGLFIAVGAAVGVFLLLLAVDVAPKLNVT